MKYLKYLLCIATVLSSCAEKQSEQVQEEKPKIVAQIYADPAFANITQELTDVYESINDSVDFQVVPISEELAVKKFINDSAVVVVISRQLYQEELDQLDTTYQKSGKEYLFAQDAVAFVVNRADADSILTKEEVLELLTKNSKGKKIVFEANHSSSIGYINKLLGKDTLNASSFATKNIDELFGFIATHKNAIGIIGSNVFSNLEDSVLLAQFSKVKILGLQYDKQIFYPFQADIAAKKYPFSRNIYILNSEHYYGKYSGFKNFVIGPKGQRIILKAGLMPIDMPNRLLNFVKKRESAP